MMDPALSDPAPGLDPAARESWIQEMTRLTDNPVEKTLKSAMATEATLQTALTKILDRLLESIMSTVSVARLGTRRDIRIEPVDLSIMPSGISYKETAAYKSFKACVTRVMSQAEVDQLAASTGSRTGTISIENFIDDMLVSMSEYSEGSSSAATINQAQTIGPYKPDLGIIVDDTLTQTVIFFAFLELKFAKFAVIQGTRLESPSTRASLSIDFKPLPSKVKLKIKQGAAQAIWYGCVITEMAQAGRPILGMLMINGWFVRLQFNGTTVFVESEARAGQSCSLTEFLQVFKKGEGFPHNIVTPEGAAAMYAYVVAAANEICYRPTPRQTPPMNDESVLAAGLKSEVGEIDESELVNGSSPDNVSFAPNKENDQASDLEFDGDDAHEYEVAKQPEKLVELLESTWIVKFCSVGEFDRLLQRL